VPAVIVPSDQFIQTDAEHTGNESEASHPPAISTGAKIHSDRLGPLGRPSIGAVTQRWGETIEMAARRAITRNHRKNTRGPVN
jgi:hypothetical protein